MSDTQTAPAPPAPAKPWWVSRTIWVNAIAVAASVAADHLGVQLSAQDQIAALGVVNLILRIITKQPVSWAATS